MSLVLQYIWVKNKTKGVMLDFFSLIKMLDMFLLLTIVIVFHMIKLSMDMFLIQQKNGPL